MGKNGWRRRIAWGLIISLMSSNAAYAGEWRREQENWVYQDQDTKVTGWLNENGNWYYLNQNGIMQTGWYRDEHQDKYYLNRQSDGAEGMMRTGWFLDNQKWYFLNPLHDGFYGRAICGKWQWIDGYCYLFDHEGVMYANCITPDGYAVNQDGQWIMNGVPQYVPGRGINTKQTSSVPGTASRGGGGGSSSGGSSNSGSGGNHGSGGDHNDNNNSDDNNENNEKTSAITVNYVDQIRGEIMKSIVLRGKVGTETVIEHPDFSGYRVKEEQTASAVFAEDNITVNIYYVSVESTGVITIQYTAKETGEIIYEKEVSGRIGDLYAIQYPVFDGYKRMDNQAKEAHFSSEAQVIPVYYRQQEEGEKPDESIVLKDNVKGILADTEEEKAQVQAIGSELFDFEMDEDGVMEWAVSNENPLMDYILEGTIEENDIVYIEACEEFPLGFTFVYQGHDDEYTGSLDTYDKDTCEVIHARKADMFELLGEGTSFSYNMGKSGDSLELSGSWIPYQEELSGAMNSPISRKGVLRERNFLDFPIFIENSLKGSLPSRDIKVKVASNSNALCEAEILVHPSLEVNANSIIDIKIPILGNKDVSAKLDFEASYSGSINPVIYAKGDLGGYLREKMRAPKNKLSMARWNIDVAGVDFENSILMAIFGFRLSLPHYVTIETNVNNILKDQLSVRNILNTFYITVPIFFDFGLKAEIKGELGIGYSGYIKTHYNSDTDEIEDIKKNFESGVYVYLKGDAGIEGQGKVGLTLGLGLAVIGFMPVLGKVSVGLKADGKINGSFELSTKEDFKSDIVAEGKLFGYVEGEARVRLAIKEEDTSLIDIDVSMPIIDMEFPIFSGSMEKEMKPAVLTIKPSMSLEAVDKYGKNISSQFKGYDSKSGTVKTVKTGGDDHYTFECPRYYAETVISGNTTKREYYEVVGIQIVGRESQNCEEVDLSRIENLESIEIHNDYCLNKLDWSKNKKLKTFSYITAMSDDFASCVDFSQNSDLEVLAIDASNIKKLDLSNNKRLKNVKILQSSCTNQKHLEELMLPDNSNIEKLYIDDRWYLPAMDFSGLPRLKELTYTGTGWDSVALSPCKNLEVLNMKSLSRLSVLDISGNPKLKTIMAEKSSGAYRLKEFTGNGLAFPPIDGPWYSSPDKEEGSEVTSCGLGQTIYSIYYKKPDDQAKPKAGAVNGVTATDSNASKTETDKRATDSNAEPYATASDALKASKTLETADEDDADNEYDAWEEELINDIAVASELIWETADMPAFPIAQKNIMDNEIFPYDSDFIVRRKRKIVV